MTHSPTRIWSFFCLERERKKTEIERKQKEKERKQKENRKKRKENGERENKSESNIINQKNKK